MVMGRREIVPAVRATRTGAVGWAKQSVPTHFFDHERWWARRRCAFADPTAPSSGLALRHALQKRLFRGVDGVGRADMHPDTVEAEAEQALLLIGAVEHFC